MSTLKKGTKAVPISSSSTCYLLLATCSIPPLLASPYHLWEYQLQDFAMKRGKSKADAPKKAESKLSVKKGPERASKKPRKSKADKDPNKPKRPPSAFFVFMEEFRKTYKEKHPNNKSVSVVGKAGGDKWKSLSEAEKAPYVAKAAKLKTEYTKKLAAYDRNQSGGGSRAADDEDESDKSKSEVHDDEDDEEESEEIWESLLQLKWSLLVFVCGRMKGWIPLGIRTTLIQGPTYCVPTERIP
ncbi:hypothetical protein Cni_G22204 [Canna indica]|uniref:HMG box domain-containing protein n=1 Tax=Canna indica TaxID=4628 RepID=A0AAQ3KRG7_9LILI|nr:hypothetical protein Cni_G22204 [Canna indica]